MQTIPKIISQLWVGPKPPAWVENCMVTWRMHHPEWGYRLWGEEARDWLTHTQDLWDNMGDYIAAGQVAQARSDLFRMEVLYRIGGVYADADFECLKPLDPLLDGVKCFTAWESDEWANLAISGSVPGHPFLKRLLDDLPAHMDTHRFAGPSSTYITGPRFVTPRLDDSVTVYPSRMFYPYSWQEINDQTGYGDAYATHHWHNARTRRLDNQTVAVVDMHPRQPR